MIHTITKFRYRNQPKIPIPTPVEAEKAVENIIHHIQERFPDQKQRIDRLISKDSEFLSLIEDYDICVAALRYWAGSDEPEAESRVIEYHTLITELEQEISQYLNCI